MTLNDLELLGISRDFADVEEATTAKRMKTDPCCQRQNWIAH